MKKLLVVLTTVSAVGLYTASGAYASCSLSLGSCDGNTVTSTKSVSVDKTVDVTKTTVIVPIGNHNGNGNSNTSGNVIAGVGNGGNSIQQTGNQSFSISHGHK